MLVADARSQDKGNRIGIHGLERTGTNLFSHVVIDYFDVDGYTYHWKHGSWKACGHTKGERLIEENGKPRRVVVISKNPYAWLVSAAKYDGSMGDFSAFLRRNYKFGRPKSHPITRYNAFYTDWLEYSDDPSVFRLLRHEDLIQPGAFVPIMESIAKDFGIELLKPLKPIEGYVGQGSKPRKKKFNTDWYRNKEYLKAFKPADIRVVNDQLDWELMSKLGYRKETK